MTRHLLRRSFLTIIRRSFLTGRGHIDSPRCQSVRRRTSRSHTGYQRLPIPQVQVAPILSKAYLTIVPQFIHSNQSSRVHLSLRILTCCFGKYHHETTFKNHVDRLILIVQHLHPNKNKWAHNQWKYVRSHVDGPSSR